MLVLTRRHMEVIRIGKDIRITVVKIAGGRVQVGIDAPEELKILRGEMEDTDSQSQGE